jgi:hypothetical protein
MLIGLAKEVNGVDTVFYDEKDCIFEATMLRGLIQIVNGVGLICCIREGK